MDKNKTLGQMLMAARVAAQRSREWAAVKVDSSWRTIENYEQGRTSAPFWVVAALLTAYGEDVAQFARGYVERIGLPLTESGDADE